MAPLEDGMERLRALIADAVASAYVDACEEATAAGRREPTFVEWQRKQARMRRGKPRTPEDIIEAAKSRLQERASEPWRRRAHAFSWDDVEAMGTADDDDEEEWPARASVVQSESAALPPEVETVDAEVVEEEPATRKRRRHPDNVVSLDALRPDARWR